jgi:TPR repeat protein
MFCTSCGKERVEKASFCAFCGVPFKPVASVSAEIQAGHPAQRRNVANTMKPRHVVFLLVCATIICVALLEFIQNRTTDAPQAPTEALKPPQGSSVGAESSSTSEPKPSQSPDLAQNLTDERADALADEAASGRDEALNALEKAASAGNPSGAYGMAAYYLKRYAGFGATDCDPIDWNYLAKVDPRAARELRRVHEHPEQFMDDKMAAERQREHNRVCDNAVSWLEKASAQSDPAAQYELGFRYLSFQMDVRSFMEDYSRVNHTGPYPEDAVSKAWRKHDCERGLLLLEKSAAARFAPAELRLGVESEIPGNLTCVSSNQKVARYWYRRSALDGSATAAISLADSYVEFKPTDFEEAKRWLARAEQLGIDSNDRAAACGMAIYYSRTGDTDEAEQWQAKCRRPGSPPEEQGEQNDENSE